MVFGVLLLSSVLQDITDYVHDGFGDMMGVEIQARIDDYKGSKVDYQYQLWRIKESSVCASKKTDIGKYSECTVLAKSLFNEVCVSLQKQTNTHWKYKKIKNMYCQAAVTFKPTIARINRPVIVNPELEKAKQRCSMLTLDAMGAVDEGVIHQRDIACKKYNMLK